MKKIFDFTVGIGVWVALGCGIYYFFIRTDQALKTYTQAELEAPLKTYKAADKEARDSMIDALMLANNGDPIDRQHYINCMGDFAENKSSSLAISKVFGWCVTESKNNRNRFISHYNELESLDEPQHAANACRTFIEPYLLAPATAEHASDGQRFVEHGKGKYTIISHVDSQNTFGALIRTEFSCTTQYAGPDAPWHATAWKPVEVEILE